MQNIYGEVEVAFKISVEDAIVLEVCSVGVVGVGKVPLGELVVDWIELKDVEPVGDLVSSSEE